MNSISNNLSLFATNQLAKAEAMNKSAALENTTADVKQSVFKSDGASISGGAVSRTMYGVFPGGGGCGGGLEVGGGPGAVAKYGVFPGGGCGGDQPIGPGGPGAVAKYGVFPHDPITPEKPGGPGAVAKYGVFPGGGCGGDQPIGPGGPGAVAKYGVFPGGGCGGNVNPFQIDFGGLFGGIGKVDFSKFINNPGKVDMSAINDAMHKGQEAARKMFESFSGSKMPSFDMSSMANTANSQLSEFQNSQALVKLAQSGSLNMEDLRAQLENGEISGSTAQLAEQILNGQFKF